MIGKFMGIVWLGRIILIVFVGAAALSREWEIYILNVYWLLPF
jgi:hypothetical protein